MAQKNGSSWFLIFKDDPSKKVRITDDLVLGKKRVPLNDVLRQDPSIKDDHIAFTLKKDKLWFMPLCGENGVFVDGRPADLKRWTRVASGVFTELRLGKLEFILQEGEELFQRDEPDIDMAVLYAPPEFM